MGLNKGDVDTIWLERAGAAPRHWVQWWSAWVFIETGQLVGRSIACRHPNSAPGHHKQRRTAAERFNIGLGLDDNEKIDYKIKAKQFVKTYGQVASIMPFEVLAWEKLFWFLKFLVPKLKIKDANQDALDELLDSVDLSSYGLERTKLGHAIKLDDSESELAPQNPNPRGHHDGEAESDPLDEIIRSFNERWFQGWGATPEEQRVKFVSILDSIRTHPDFAIKYDNNHDHYNRSLALEQMLKDVMLKRRKQELELYKLYASDTAFKSAWFQNIERALNQMR